MKAGDYKFLYTWLQCERTTDNTTGARPKSFTDNGTFWGNETHDSAQEEEVKGAIRDTIYGTIRLRNLNLGITALDRLQGGYFDLLWEIDGCRQDYTNNETILDVHSLVLLT